MGGPQQKFIGDFETFSKDEASLTMLVGRFALLTEIFLFCLYRISLMLSHRIAFEKGLGSQCKFIAFLQSSYKIMEVYATQVTRKIPDLTTFWRLLPTELVFLKDAPALLSSFGKSVITFCQYCYFLSPLHSVSPASYCCQYLEEKGLIANLL